MAHKRIKRAFVVILAVIVLVFVVSFARGIFSGGAGKKIGVLEIEGVITESRNIMEEIVRFKEDDSIRGVIVRINTPGGSVAPTQEIFRELRKLKTEKKVFVSMGSVCASSGYYIASVGDRIYANPSTITGSIGVIMELAEIETLLKKIGLKATTIKAGEYKDIGSPFRPMTETERNYLSTMAKTIQAQFIKDIVDARKGLKDKVPELSNAMIFLGTEARKIGLVDEIGTFYDTVEGMKIALNIKEKPELVYSKKPFSIVRTLLSSIAKEIVATYLYPAQFR